MTAGERPEGNPIADMERTMWIVAIGIVIAMAVYGLFRLFNMF